MSTTGMNYQERDDEYVRFINDYCSDELSDVATKYPKEKETFTIDWKDVYAWDSDVALDTRDNPGQFREMFRYAIQDANRTQQNLDGIEVRFKNVGDPQSVPELLRGDDESKLVTLRGQVAKTSEVVPRLETAHVFCKGCTVKYDVAVPDHGEVPIDQCKQDGCRSTNIEIEFNESESLYHQLARVRQPPEGGNSDGHIDVHLTKDAAGSVEGGERVDISGVLNAHFDSHTDATPNFYVVADAVEHHESDYEQIDATEHKEEFEAYANGDHGDPYQLLIDSVAPSIKADEKMESIKLAIGLMLFSGWRRPYGDGRYARGDPHICIIGDPGTGKSSLLDAAESISPRSSFVSGKNASKAGVTAAAVRDDFGETEWSLESGAIVQAHKGVACIDEIDKVEKGAISSLHTALEKQRLEVSKAGINASLACETSLLAAGNPRDGRFIEDENDIVQLNIPPALRTRFDLIYTLRDTYDSEHDKDLAEHITKMRTQSGMTARTDLPESDIEVGTPAVGPDVLRAWIAYARENIQPVIQNDGLSEHVASEYNRIRGNDNGEMGIGPRSVDAIHRLAEASARIRLSQEVKREDIERAVGLITDSLADLGIMDGEGKATGQGDMLETGVGKQEREERRTIRGIIRELSDGKNGVKIDNVIETASQAETIDKPEGEIRHEIQRMIDNSEATRPDMDDKVRLL